MITVIPFKPEHAMAIQLQPKQLETVGVIHPADAAELARIGPAFTGVDGDKVIFCGGRAEMWQGRALCWSLLSADAGKHMVRMTRIARRLLDMQEGYGRVEALVREDFEQAHRWVKMLGFKFECRKERYLPGGLNAVEYVRFC